MARILFLCMFIIGCVYARDYSIGLEYGNANAKVKGSVPALNVNYEEKVAQNRVGLKLGEYYKFDDADFRATIMFNHYNSETNEKIVHASYAIDYLFMSGKLKPFIGVSISYFQDRLKNLTQIGYDKDSMTFSAVPFGGQVGGIYEVNEKFNVELGYRLILLRARADNTITQGGTVYPVEFQIKNMQDLYFGLNYKF